MPPRSTGNWVSMAGQATASTGFTDFTAYGPDTIAQGGGAPIPDWARGIDIVKISAMSNYATAAGAIAGVRFNKGLYGGGAQYLLGPNFSGQTTSAEGTSVPAQIIKLDTGIPFLRPAGNRLQIGGTCAPTDPGQISMVVSVRFTPESCANPLWFQAAAASTTAATDLLSTAMTAIGGDTTFPVSVPRSPKALGIRYIQTAFGTDQAAAGDSVGEIRLQGKGLEYTPQDFGSTGAGTESAAATGVAAALTDSWDDWLGVNPGDLIAAVFGYTGTDSGTECAGVGLGFMLEG